MNDKAIYYAQKAGATELQLLELKEYFSVLKQENLAENFMDGLSNRLFDREYPLEKFCEELISAAQKSELNDSAFYIAFYVANFDRLFKLYKDNGIDEWVFFDTIRGLFAKTGERKILDDKLGVDSYSWFVEFFRLNRFGIGRLEYNLDAFRFDSYTKRGITLEKGETVLSIHIPAGGKLTKDVRLDSYKKARDFFMKRGLFKGGVMKAICHSWILFPNYLNVFPKTSNLYDFCFDFDVIHADRESSFKDGWRVFGGAFNGAQSDLPLNTTLQKNFYEYMRSVNEYGEGYGVLLFDGKELLK